MAFASDVANPSVERARARRADAAAAQDVEIQWFIRAVCDKIAMSMKQRVRIATELVKNRVVQNISTPVTKGTGPRGGRVITNRSSPGEFPHAETTQLMKTIFGEVREEGSGDFNGYVGTPLDYGLILEVRMERSFLRRTLEDSRAEVTQILSGPIS